MSQGAQAQKRDSLAKSDAIRLNQVGFLPPAPKSAVVVDAAATTFTIENEQLTPSMKIRRHVIKQAYGERLEALYKK